MGWVKSGLNDCPEVLSAVGHLSPYPRRQAFHERCSASDVGLGDSRSIPRNVFPGLFRATFISEVSNVPGRVLAAWLPAAYFMGNAVIFNERFLSCRIAMATSSAKANTSSECRLWPASSVNDVTRRYGFLRQRARRVNVLHLAFGDSTVPERGAELVGHLVAICISASMTPPANCSGT